MKQNKLKRNLKLLSTILCVLIFSMVIAAPDNRNDESNKSADGLLSDKKSDGSTDENISVPAKYEQTLNGYKVLVVGDNYYRPRAAYRISALGATVSEAEPAALTQTMLDANDILWVALANADDVNEAGKTSIIRNWISSGHGMIVEQPNQVGPVYLLPYTFTISDIWYTGQCTRNVIDPTHPITNGIAPNDLPACYDTVGSIGSEWKVLVRDGTNDPSLSVANYGNGRIIVELDNTGPGTCVCGICQTDIAIERMIKWAKVEKLSVSQSVFVRSTDNALWYRGFDGTSWSSWKSLGGVLSSDPDAASLSGNTYAFVRGTDNKLWYRKFDGTSWSSWANLGGVLNSAPGATSWNNKVYVFVRGTDNKLWYRTFDGTSWSSWANLGGALTSGPGAS